MICYVLKSYSSFSWVYPVICRVFISIPRRCFKTIFSPSTSMSWSHSILGARIFFGGEGDSALHELFQWSNWMVVSNIFYFHPSLGKMNQFWLIFFKWVETTNQSKHGCCFYIHHSLECIFFAFNLFFTLTIAVQIIPDWSRWLHETHFGSVPWISSRSYFFVPNLASEFDS